MSLDGSFSSYSATRAGNRLIAIALERRSALIRLFHHKKGPLLLIGAYSESRSRGVGVWRKGTILQMIGIDSRIQSVHYIMI